jgi:AraC-like DNA-binding protein
MHAQDYLTLRLVRLKSSEEWSLNREGLSFVFLKGGNGKYVAGNDAQKLAPGDVIVVQGCAGGKLCLGKGAEMVFWSFLLRSEHLFPLFDGSELSLLQSVMNGFKNSKLFPASTVLARRCHRLIEEVPPQFNLDHRSQLLRAAAAILTEEFKTAHAQRIGSASVEQRMVEVFEQLSVDQLLSLSVGELAVKFGCSRRHLNRLFHQFFGYSVAALRMEMRLLKAISLLRDTSEKIINVAEKCGFNHLGLFNTCFKRRFGISPGEWRKQGPRDESQPANPLGSGAACPFHPKGLCPMAGRPHSLASLVPKSPPIQKTSAAKASPGILTTNHEIQHHLLTADSKPPGSIAKSI